jgi:opacity protein-like surface antigen
MKERSQALLASAVLAAGSAAAAVAAEPPLKTLPSQQDIWITGTIQRGSGQYALGDYMSLRLDRPSTSPCNDKVVTDIVLGPPGP